MPVSRVYAIALLLLGQQIAGLFRLVPGFVAINDFKHIAQLNFRTEVLAVSNQFWSFHK